MPYHPGLTMLMAKDFLTTADDCMRPVGENHPGGNPADSLRVVPAITNAAFSAELSIKSGYVVNGREAREGHDLRDLFLNLPNDLRERIKGSMRTRLPVNEYAFRQWPTKDRVCFRQVAVHLRK